LAGHNVKPPKAEPKVQRKEEPPTLFHAQNNPSKPPANILSDFLFFYKRKSTASRP
jgi:hypothetical protein